MKKVFLCISVLWCGWVSAQVVSDSVRQDSVQYLTADDLFLQEVKVTAKRSLFERKMDKVVFNVSQSPLAAGTNGKDLLKKAPGIFVDKDGNVTYNGKSVEVYVDGRPSYLSGDQLRAMLEGMDGSTIEKIELISNPGAKYDASGTGGIINIKTKRNMMRGLNGTLNASYGGMYFKDVDRWLNNDFVGLNLNYRTAKTYTYAQINQYYGDFSITNTTHAYTPFMKRDLSSEYKADFQYYMLKIGNDWYIDSVNTLGFFIQTPTMVQSQHAPADKGGGTTAFLSSTGTDSLLIYTTSMTRSHTLAPQHTANLNFTHIFSDDLERELTVNVDYNRYNSNATNLQHNIEWADEANKMYSGLDIRTHQISNIYSAKLDFQTKFWQTGMIETGAKYILSTMNSRMTTDSLQGEEWGLFSSTPSDFDYREHVAALYISLAKQFGEHWNVKLGLRGEYTYSIGDWLSADSVSRKSYFDLFPTIFMGYTSSPLGKLQQRISVSASYVRRIKRPNYYVLNPFRTYINAHSYSVGNTEMTPEFNNDVELNFSYSQYMSLTFNFSHTQDMFSQHTEILDNGDGRAMWMNFGTCTTHGFNLSLTELPLVPKFNSEHKVDGAWLALTVNAGYYNFLNKSYKKNADGSPEYKQQNNYFRCNGILNAYLPKDWTISMDAFYSAPITIGYNRQRDIYEMGFGVRKQIKEKGLVLNLQVQDLLRSSNYEERSQGLPEGQYTCVENKVRQQRVTFTLTYMFGHQEWHKQRKVGDSEFNDRLGSGNSIGQ